MFNPGFGWGFGHGLFSVFANVVAGLAFMLCVTITLAVLFLLVRFLLVGTRAAQLYVARHEPERPTRASSTPPVGSPPVGTPPTDSDPTTAAKGSTAPASVAAEAPATKSAAKSAEANRPAPKTPPAS